MTRTLSIRTWLTLALIVIVLLALLGWRAGCAAAKRAGAERDVAVVVGQQLDRVTTETSAVRQEQQEQERAVENIPGAAQPLPAGFGAELERVRRGRGDQHPRQPEG